MNGQHAVFDEAHETFRNELASVHKDGRRKWVYARQPHGRYYRARTWLSWGLLAFLFGAPFVTFRGQPLILLNILERRFVLFGVVFWPQDFYLVVLIALTVLVTLALSTAAVGRVWCGWLCPQTIFLEMLFRKIEYVIEGSAAQQLRRDKAPWTADTAWRKGLKHAIFFVLSFVIANVFLAYIIGEAALVAIITDPPSEHLAGLFAITIFSLLFYGVFARFREQACTLACPYGRVMSALIDRDTITVTYDAVRGEPRGRLARPRTTETPDPAARRGDCIDCAQCVTVCPTGIDIRNGIQLECVNCTACMDACDDVMQRLQRPTGLIRLTSHNAIQTGAAHWLTTRVKAYAAVWVVLLAAAVTLVAARPAADVLILREPGLLFAELDNDELANFYSVQVINRLATSRQFDYRAVEPAGATVAALGPIAEAPPNSLVEGRLVLRVPRSALAGASTPVRIEVRSEGEIVQTVASSFLGPAAGSARAAEAAGGAR